MNKDKLTHMFEMQFNLQKNLNTFNKIETTADKQQFINQNLLAIFEETVEIMRETAYKNPDFCKFGWKKNQQFNIEKAKDEIIDLWHFLMNLCLVFDMSADEFYNLYLKKNKINIERKKNGY